MKPPVILVEGQDVSFFSSAAALERYMESPDIPCYQVFDADGQVLRLTTDVSLPERWPRLGQMIVGKVKVSYADPPCSAAEELVRILSEHLERLTGQPSKAADLGELIREIAQQIGIDN